MMCLLQVICTSQLEHTRWDVIFCSAFDVLVLLRWASVSWNSSSRCWLPISAFFQSTCTKMWYTSLTLTGTRMFLTCTCNHSLNMLTTALVLSEWTRAFVSTRQLHEKHTDINILPMSSSLVVEAFFLALAQPCVYWLSKYLWIEPSKYRFLLKKRTWYQTSQQSWKVNTHWIFLSYVSQSE